MILETYCRSPEGKRRCLELAVQQGIDLPDTPAAELECHADTSLALHGTPLAGATLLHLCVDGDAIEIDEGAPGYKHIFIQPRPGGGITRVEASHETPHGKVASAWTTKDGRFELLVEVPPNSRATVRLPKAQLATVTESGKPLLEGNGVTGRRQDGEVALVEVGSGRYRFAHPFTP